MYQNHESVIAQLEAHGLVIDQLEVGRLTRCATVDDSGRKKSGWYSLHELRLENGHLVLIGAFGNFREGVSDAGRPISHRIDLKKEPLTPAERAAIRHRVALEKKRSHARRAEEADRAARRAERFWRALSSTGVSAYLARKGISGFGVKYTDRGTLAIPIADSSGRICGLQLIYDDPEQIKERGRDRDFWPAGLDKHGKYHLIGAPGWIVLLCEGYATGASLHEATGLPVAVAFDAGGLAPVALALRKRYRKIRILVCADDDYLIQCRSCKTRYLVDDGQCPKCKTPAHCRNTGVLAANATALAVGGSVCIPEFSGRTLNDKLTDFNDLHLSRGLAVVRAQVEDCIKELGWQMPARDATFGGGGDGGWDFSVNRLLDRYSLVYGTETVFDADRRRVIGLGPLRAAGGRNNVTAWLEHADRKLVLPEQVVFDPTLPLDMPDQCNLWGGWPTVPEKGECALLLELLDFLCSNEDDPRGLYNWVLNWLAYPIQNPGAKMQTSILMHGPEGTGKNTFFGVIRKIYGQYGGIFDQTQLESQFNGWASGKLFMIGNEVVTRVELYHQQGRLKNMITEDEWQINEKQMPTRLEANHCNFVFFSNRVDIAKLDPTDRRYCVIWTPEAAPEGFYLDVADEIAGGGVAALHQVLLDRDIGDFSPHTKPPVTRARRDLIELSMDSTDRFWFAWLDGHLPVPVTVCVADDFYSLYRDWSQREGLRNAAPKHILLGAIGKKRGVQRTQSWINGRNGRVRRRLLWPPSAKPDPAKPQISWLTEQTDSFRVALNDWKEGLLDAL